MANLILNRIVGRPDIQRRWLQAGVRPQYWQYIKEGRTVSVDYKGGTTSTQITQIYVDGRPQLQRALPISKPEGPRPRATPRAQYLGQGAEVQVVRSPGGITFEEPKYPGEIDRSGLTGGLQDASEQSRPETTILSPFEIKPFPRREERAPSLSELGKTTASAFLFPTPKKSEKLFQETTKFESVKITPKLEKLTRVPELEAQLKGASVKGLEFKIGPIILFKTPSQKELISAEIGARQFLSRPLTKVLPEVSLGVATGGVFKGVGLALNKALSASKLLAGRAGTVARRVTTAGITGTFVASEAVSVAKAKEPSKRIGEIPARLISFGLGAKAIDKLITPSLRRQIGTPYAELQRQEKLIRTKAPQGKKFFEPFIKLQRATQSAERKGKLIPAAELTPKIAPADIPQKIRAPIIKAVKEKDLIVFGSESIKLKFPKTFEKTRSKFAGETKLVADLDVAAKASKKALAHEQILATAKTTGKKLEIKAESIGIKGGEKFVDIKELSRVEGFEFTSPIVKTPKGIKTTAISEELARKIAGGIAFRKKGKDIPDIKAISELLIQPKVAKKIGIKPSLIKEVKISLEKELTPKTPDKLFRPEAKIKITTARQRGPSRIPSSLPSKISSRIPSRLPSRLPSKIPTSKIPRSSSLTSLIKPSKTPAPSRVPSVLKPSKVPASKIASKIPSSRIPSSRIPGYKPSRLSISKIPSSKIPGQRAPSKFPPSRIPRVRVITEPAKVPDIQFKLVTEKEKKPRVLARLFKYQPSVEAKALNIKGVSIPKILTGITTRKIRI